jgi:hypothetical protein
LNISFLLYRKFSQIHGENWHSYRQIKRRVVFHIYEIKRIKDWIDSEHEHEQARAPSVAGKRSLFPFNPPSLCIFSRATQKIEQKWRASGSALSLKKSKTMNLKNPSELKLLFGSSHTHTHTYIYTVFLKVMIYLFIFNLQAEEG